MLPEDVITLKKLRQSSYLDYPMEVHMETFAYCNAACSFCPYPKIDRKGERMSDALIDKIITDLTAIPVQHPFFVSPFKVNDPLLDTRIFDVCDKVTDRLPNASLRFFTNGSPLTDRSIERIGKLKRLGTLWVSLNEIDADRYYDVMKLPLDRTRRALDKLHAARRDGRFRLGVTVSRVADGSERDKLFVDFIGWTYPLFRPFLIGRDEWLGQVNVKKDVEVPDVGCWRWYELSIMATGKVALCCMDGEGKHVIGDVNTENVLDVYNSPRFRKLRSTLTSRRDAEAPCNTCNYD